MGLTCSSENITNSKSISNCELDKIIFIEYQYMNGIIQQNDITSYYPQLNFAEFEKEKGNRVKKRHFFKWYKMSYNKNKNKFENVPMEMIFKHQNETNNNTKQVNQEENNNNPENNSRDNKSEEVFPPLNEDGISGSEEGLRLYDNTNQSHFESRVVKGPPVAFRWLSWLIVTKVPKQRPMTPYYNLQTYPLSLEIENQIQKELTKTLEQKHIMGKEIKECIYRILKAIMLLDPKMSYVKGIELICGFLFVISNQNEIDTFYIMISLFSQTFSLKFRIREFFTKKLPMIDIYYKIFLRHVQNKFPKVAEHIKKLTLPYLYWIGHWMKIMYVNVFPNEVVVRIWDCLFVYGMSFLISFGLSIVEVIERDFLKITDLIKLGEYFKLFNPANKSSLTDMKIKYDIEVMLKRAISKYLIPDKEVENEINNKNPNLNVKIVYYYDKIEPYHQPNISNIQNSNQGTTINSTNIITQEKKDEKDIIIPTEQEILHNNSITTADFEVEDETVDKEEHFKDLQKFIKISMKKTDHVLTSQFLNNINK